MFLVKVTLLFENLELPSEKVVKMQNYGRMGMNMLESVLRTTNPTVVVGELHKRFVFDSAKCPALTQFQVSSSHFAF